MFRKLLGHSHGGLGGSWGQSPSSCSSSRSPQSGGASEAPAACAEPRTLGRGWRRPLGAAQMPSFWLFSPAPASVGRLETVGVHGAEAETLSGERRTAIHCHFLQQPPRTRAWRRGWRRGLWEFPTPGPLKGAGGLQDKKTLLLQRLLADPVWASASAHFPPDCSPCPPPSAFPYPLRRTAFP